MTFTRVSQWHEASDCGRYTVAIAKCGSTFKFSACRLRERQPGELLGTFDDIESARQRCVEHSERTEAA